jgi:hypothetical protein
MPDWILRAIWMQRPSSVLDTQHHRPLSILVAAHLLCLSSTHRKTQTNHTLSSSNTCSASPMQRSFKLSALLMWTTSRLCPPSMPEPFVLNSPYWALGESPSCSPVVMMGSARVVVGLQTTARTHQHSSQHFQRPPPTSLLSKVLRTSLPK